MLITLILLCLGAWFFYSGWKFYHRMDWEEPAESSPDFQQMHKRQAELLHIQELLEKARGEGKLTADFMDEFTRFCDHEIESMQAAETAWKSRRRSFDSPVEKLIK